MSVDVVAWVFRYSEATANDRLVLLAIADEADDDGTNAFPSIDRIASKARIPKRTVMRCLTRLEEAEALVVHRPATRGRGHYNTYVVVMAVPEKGVTLTPDEAVAAARETARKGAERRAAVRDSSQTHRPIDPVVDPGDAIPGVETVSTTRGVANAVSISNLCNMLATSIDLHRNGTGRPKITKAWERDMRLLIERGELGVDGAKGHAPDAIARAIAFVFEHLADPGRDGFCWADQVQSPGALRRHWPKLVDAKRKIEQGTGVSRGARTIDRTAARLIEQDMLDRVGPSGDRPRLELLPGASTQGG